MRRNTGFTAVELLVVITIVGILAALALPSFNEMMNRYQLEKDTQALKSTIMYAQSEAIKWGGNIRILRNDSCTGASADWSCGWMVQIQPVPTNFVGVVPVDGVLRVINTSRKNDIQVQGGSSLSLNRWGNPNAGFGVSLQSKNNGMMSNEVCVSSGGRVSVQEQC